MSQSAAVKPIHADHAGEFVSVWPSQLERSDVLVRLLAADVAVVDTAAERSDDGRGCAGVTQ